MSKAAELAKIGEVATSSQIGGRRNIIINGGMNVAQRNTSVAGIGAADGYFTLDRWGIYQAATAGRLTMAQVADVHDGFANAMKLTCTTADASVAAGEFIILRQSLEGQDVQQLQYGTSDAKKLTVSFYVKGNASAKYTCELQNNDNSRTTAQTFDVTTDWTRVILTFNPDTVDGFNDDNGISLTMLLWLHAGSTYTGGTFVSNTWADTVTNTRVGDSVTSFLDSTNRTFFITGVQMEVGSVATPFEHRSFGEELALGQRYFYRHTISYLSGYCPTTTRADVALQFPCEMRIAPTAFTAVGTASHLSIQNEATATACNNAPVVNLPDNVTSSGIRMIASVGSGLTVGNGVILYNPDAADNDYHVTFSSEL